MPAIGSWCLIRSLKVKTLEGVTAPYRRGFWTTQYGQRTLKKNYTSVCGKSSQSGRFRIWPLLVKHDVRNYVLRSCTQPEVKLNCSSLRLHHSLDVDILCYRITRTFNDTVSTAEVT